MQLSSTVSLLGLLCTVAATLWLTYRQLHSRGLKGEQLGLALNAGGTLPINVCFCTDDTDLRATAVAMRSVLANAATPKRVKFHVVTTPELTQLFKELLGEFLPEAEVQVYSNDKMLKRISSLVTYRASSNVRRELASVFNFAPFFLPDFLLGRSLQQDMHRLILLDTDTVMLGDVGTLHDLGLRGKAVAAVRSCRQRIDTFIDFDVLRLLVKPGTLKLRPTDCIASRSVMVIDVPRWRSENISGKISNWLVRYRDQPLGEDLWTKSLTVPPLTLALDRSFHDLGAEWDCMWLGEESLTMTESKELRGLKMTHADLKLLGLTQTRYGEFKPGIHRCAAKSKLLHFGGSLKPWTQPMRQGPENKCAMPAAAPPSPRGWAREGEAEEFLECKELRFVNCSSLWWAYLTDEQDCGLKDFDKEYRLDAFQYKKKPHGTGKTAAEHVASISAATQDAETDGKTEGEQRSTES
eukprot:TRINITY_DN22252_c0_g1_i1.p1 TRINITY_DN22252_c0_g1~~TRINITY_DN22252_c0_g1_i1.p1  ORF type:complete len:467 (+),score=93.11 TRINITY_DN22252_c0_g1_i1:40-1440(+)